MLAFFVVSIPMLLTQSVVALQAVPSLISRQDAAMLQDEVEQEKCREPGKLFFSHIMKDGGSSVDQYLNCICEKSNASIWHVESQALFGAKKCKPTVCTSHDAVAGRSRKTECGSDFSDSKVFTALRDPVDRLYSFYTYMRYKKQDAYFQDKTLDELLHDYEKCYDNYDWFICAELNNTMVGKYFNNPVVEQLRQTRMPDEELNGNGFRRMSTADLDSAKTMLASLGAIFFTEDFSRFSDLFYKSGLPLARQAYACDFPHVNENVCDYCKPSKQALKIINRLNWADIELYNYAKNLSNRVQ